MVEHLLLGDIATLLLVLGLTGPLLQPILAIPLFDRLRVLAHPLVAFPLWAINFYVWHIPALYDAAYGTAPMHALEHTTFIFFGCLMWMPVFGPLPKPQWFTAAWKVGYVIAVRFAGAILGNVLMWSGTVLYPIYAAGRALLGDLAARRPEHRRRDDDDRGHLPRPRRCWPGSSSRPPARGSRSSACSTSPTSAASSSTPPAPSARSPPATATRLEKQLIAAGRDPDGRAAA